MSIGKKIANYIKYQREKRGYSINQFARLINVDSSFLLRLEKGVYDDIKLSNLIKIAKVLNMSLSDLLIKCQLVDEKKINLPTLEFFFKEKFQLPEQAIEDIKLFLKFIEKKYKKEIAMMRSMHKDYWMGKIR